MAAWPIPAQPSELILGMCCSCRLWGRLCTDTHCPPSANTGILVFRPQQSDGQLRHPCRWGPTLTSSAHASPPTPVPCSAHTQCSCPRAGGWHVPSVSALGPPTYVQTLFCRLPCNFAGGGFLAVATWHLQVSRYTDVTRLSASGVLQSLFPQKAPLIPVMALPFYAFLVLFLFNCVFHLGFVLVCCARETQT